MNAQTNGKDIRHSLGWTYTPKRGWFRDGDQSAMREALRASMEALDNPAPKPKPGEAPYPLPVRMAKSIRWIDPEALEAKMFGAKEAPAASPVAALAPAAARAKVRCSARRSVREALGKSRVKLGSGAPSARRPRRGKASWYA